MSSRLPSEILNSDTFKKRLKEILKGYSGIYALYRKDHLYYVGLTTDLFGRIKGHLKDRHAGKWNSFVIFRIRRIRYLKDIETLIIKLFKPSGNTLKGRVPRDSDINQLLGYMLKEEEKKIRVIKEAITK